ncbi:ROK family transcriptional regulator [Variovorax ureilyticus]|uniref:MarR family transcriptional regulator n=1 Tax=Variovorax ureilyticus TaxID=1836198 RepID=UPI003D666DEF
MKTKGDQQLVKRINRSVLLRPVRAQPGLSRARLAAESGLTKSTVSLLVRELLDDGWLEEAGASVADGMGRPSTPLHINVGVRALVGVEIAIEVLRVVCVSLQGDVLHSDAQPLADHTPAVVCAQVARMVAAAHRHLLASGLRLSGIGVGVPGAVHDATGVVRFAPNLGWRDVDLLPQLSGRSRAKRSRMWRCNCRTMPMRRCSASSSSRTARARTP